MHAAQIELGADFDPWDDLEAQFRPFIQGFCISLNGIVIGDGDGFQPFSLRISHNLGRGKHSVGCGSVEMEINPAHHPLSPVSRGLKQSIIMAELHPRIFGFP